MAGIDAAPEARHALPADFAAELGQCVADFGWLEEIIKRALYALARSRLAGQPSAQDLQAWVDRVSDIADDSMGTLIEQLDAAMRRGDGVPARTEIIDRLHLIKRQRNLLCHASWRPTSDPDRWHPAFVNTRGEIHDTDFDRKDLAALRKATLDVGAQVVQVMKATGMEGHWPGDDPA